MKTKSKIGPTHDTAFFDAIQAAFDKYPDIAKDYSIRHIGGVVDAMRVDLDRQVAVSNVQDGEIVTKFVDRSPDPVDPPPDPTTDPGCCEWRLRHHEWVCVEVCMVPPPT
ncbi:hypothetical protein ACFCVY_27895 [Streptomyces sp. NPDC056411]|uniref:hypothetical protein n=1 Tax=Streptomyces sp. NPDC056411 TaxID=3345813 RepID=UPI0035E152B0